MAAQSTLYPVLLLPVKVETRFVQAGDRLQLWVRIFPDTVFLNAFNPNLTEEEQTDRARFLALDETSTEKRESLWRELVGKYGVYRAKWIIHATEVGNSAAAADLDYIFDWLPSSFDVYLFGKAGEEDPMARQSTAINERKLAGLAEETEGARADDWIYKFDETGNANNALNRGMGVVFDSVDPDNLPEKIVVVGIKDTDAEDAGKNFATLLQQHEHTYGFAVLDHATPTNNTPGQKSGYNSEEEFDALGSFDYAVRGHDFAISPFAAARAEPPMTDAAEQQRFNERFAQLKNIADKLVARLPAHANTLASYFGLEVEKFSYVQGAERRNPPLFRLVREAAWFALGGQSLDLLLGEHLSPDDHRWLWNHYRDYVSPLGKAPAIRIDDQPYGILAAMPAEELPARAFTSEDGPRIAKLHALSQRLQQRLKAIVNQPNSPLPRNTHAGTSDIDLVKMMTTLPGSTGFHLTTYDLPRIQGYLSPAWQTAADLPVPLASLPLARVVKLLPQEAVKNIGDAAANWSGKIRQLLGSGQTDELINARVLEAIEQSPLGVLTPPMKIAIAQAATKPGVKLDMLPPRADWYLGDFFDFTARVNGLVSKPSPAEDLLKHLQTDPPSILTDVLYRSYANASQLFKRWVRFEPTENDLRAMRGCRELIVDTCLVKEGVWVTAGQPILKIKAKVNKSDNRPLLLEVLAPFAGTVTGTDRLTAGKSIAVAGEKLFYLSDETAQQQVTTAMNELFAGIVVACATYPDEQQLQKDLTAAFNHAYDVNAYRLDAWATSLAERQLSELRAKRPRGLYYGAFGYLEDLSYDPGSVAQLDRMIDENAATGGYLHAPSPAQAATAAIMKNAFLNQVQLGEPENPFTLKLTSERVRKSKQLFAGMRQQQSISALLGYELERQLHDGDMDAAIYPLRRLFPLEVNLMELGREVAPMTDLAVINGQAALDYLRRFATRPEPRHDFGRELKLATGRGEGYRIPGTEGRKIYDLIKGLEDLLDGGLDTLFYEAAYHLINGNMARSAAAMDAFKGAVTPPETSSLRTNIPGYSLSHRLVVACREPLETVIDSVRAFLEPRIEHWLQKHLGSLERISFNVQFSNEQNEVVTLISVQLDELGWSHSDLLYRCEETFDEDYAALAQRIRSLPGIAPDLRGQTMRVLSGPTGAEAGPDLRGFLTTCRYAYRLFTQSTPLFSGDLREEEEETVAADWELATSWLEQRLTPVILLLADRSDPLVAETFAAFYPANPTSWRAELDTPRVLQLLRQFDLENLPGVGEEMTVEVQNVLRAEIDEKVRVAINQLRQFTATEPTPDNAFSTAFEHLQKAAGSLLGQDFVLLPPAHLPGEIVAAFNNPDRQKQLIGTTEETGQSWGRERVRRWVQEVATVKKNVAAFENWQLARASWGERSGLANEASFLLAQTATDQPLPWIGLSHAELEQRFRAHPEMPRPAQEEWYPDGAESLILFTDPNPAVRVDEPFYGLLVDYLREEIPQREVTTGVSFEYDAPNSEAPQALLLVTPPPRKMPGPGNESGFRWEEEDLLRAVLSTVDLAKTRLLDLDTAAELAPLLPFSHWFNVPQTS